MSNGFYITGLPIQLVNTQKVRANKDVRVRAATNFSTIVDTIVTSDTSGSFVLPFTIPTSEQNRLITWTFTELETSNVVVRTSTTPRFDKNIILTVDSVSGSLVAGQDSVTGTVLVSQGYGVTLNLINELNQNIGSVSISDQQGVSNFSIQIEEQIVPTSTYMIKAIADIHDVKQISFVATILEAVTIENVSGLIYPGRVFNVSGLGPANGTINLNLFGIDTLVNVPSNQQWSVSVTAPPTLGSYLAVATGSNGVQSSKQIEVETVSLTLDFCNTGVSLTNTAGNFASFSGRLLPSKLLTVTFTGLDISSVSVVPNADGEWELEVSQSWLSPGSWSATFSAPGETPILCSGTHAPALRFIPEELTLKQGDTNNSVQIRGLPSSTYNYLVSGILSSSGSITTNSFGFATINLPDVPLLANTVSGGLITIDSSSASYEVNPRVPITINVSNPSALINDTTVLFTNSNFNVVGAIPTNGIYSLSGIGSLQSFSLTNANLDMYTALLQTTEPGELELTVATVFQPSVKASYIVSEPISFNIPTAMVGGVTYPITITSVPGELVQLEISGDADGDIVFIVGEIPLSGTYTYNFDTSQLSTGQILYFTISNLYFSFEPQERTLAGLNNLEPPFDLAINTYTGARFPSIEPQNVVEIIDSQPINEAGTPYQSGLVSRWSPPLNTTNFLYYYVEQYTPALGWQFIEITSNNSVEYSPVRVTAIYESNTISAPVYSSSSGGLQAKSAQSLKLNTINSATVIDVPEAGTLYTAIVPNSQEDPITLTLNTYNNSDVIIVPEALPFYSALLTNFQEDTQALGLFTFNSATTVIILENSPFFTV